MVQWISCLVFQILYNIIHVHRLTTETFVINFCFFCHVFPFLITVVNGTTHDSDMELLLGFPSILLSHNFKVVSIFSMILFSIILVFII